jgi:ubiquinone/menaquinone biosynthesis C-methylase UbiE
MFKRVPYDTFAVRVYRVLLDPLIRPLRSKIVRLCRELGVGEVLDIASATGVQCRMLAEAGMCATGVDLSEAMIAAARKSDGRNARYIIASAYSLPFADASFDACLLSLALHEHSEEEREIMLDEALRVLRPDGHLVVADYSKPPHTILHIPWYVIRFIEGIAGAAHRAGFHDFMRRGGLAGLLERHALTSVRQARSHLGTIGIAVVRRER